MAVIDLRHVIFRSYAGDSPTGVSSASLVTTKIDLSSIKYRARERGALETKDIEAGMSIETELAQSVSWSPKYRLVALVTETDIALPLAKRILVNQVSETDTAQSITAVKFDILGQAIETDEAGAILWSPKSRFVAQISETDLAQSITSRKTIIIGQAVETDEAQPIETGTIVSIAQVTETDTAQVIAWNPKIRIIGQITETDTSQTITVVTGGGQGFTELDNNLWAGNLEGQEFDDTMPA